MKKCFVPGELLGVWKYIGEAEPKRIKFKSRNHPVAVRRHIVECTNCGVVCERDQSNLKLEDTQGCKNCSMLPRGTAGLNQLYTHYIQRAKKRGGEMLMSIDEFKSFTSSSCAHCGNEPSATQFGSSRTEWSGYKYNGLDRVDSSNLNYSVNNCDPCCMMCNFAKHDFTAQEFEIWKNRLVDFHKGKHGKAEITL